MLRRFVARLAIHVRELPDGHRERAISEPWTFLPVAILVCEQEPENAERAALRWLRRLLDHPDITLAELRQALDAFALLVEPDGAEATLRRLAGWDMAARPTAPHGRRR